MVLMATSTYSQQSDETVFTVHKKKGLTISPEPVGMASGREYTYKLGGVPPHSIISVDFDGGIFHMSDTSTITIKARKLLRFYNFKNDSAFVRIVSQKGWYDTKNYCPTLTIKIEDSGGVVIDSIVRNVCIIPTETNYRSNEKKYPNWKKREEIANQSLKKED